MRGKVLKIIIMWHKKQKKKRVNVNTKRKYDRKTKKRKRKILAKRIMYAGVPGNR